jgi:hypothetical protein
MGDSTHTREMLVYPVHSTLSKNLSFDLSEVPTKIHFKSENYALILANMHMKDNSKGV